MSGMRILNVLEIDRDVPNIIESFPIYEEQFSQEIIEKAELLFIETINKLIHPDVLSDEEQEYYLDEGNYSDSNGYEIYIIWSNINE